MSWGLARSSFYAARHQDARPAERPAGRRGPQPTVSDANLLAAIRRDLDRSPWTGEGHRKVWARLRVIDGVRVSRTRVLRLMQGEPVEGLSRRLGVAVYKLEEWRQRGLAGIDGGLRERDDDPKERELAEAHRRIGELSMEIELLRARLEKPGPLARRRSR